MKKVPSVVAFLTRSLDPARSGSAINTFGHRTRTRLSVSFFFFLHIFNSNRHVIAIYER